MHKYTVMRPFTEQDIERKEEALWVVWDVEADTEEEAFEYTADIPGEYMLFDSSPVTVNIQPETKLKVQKENEHS